MCNDSTNMQIALWISGVDLFTASVHVRPYEGVHMQVLDFDTGNY
jgi:hypothetical protein